MYDAPMYAPQGWQCPICHRVYSPSTFMCYYCVDRETTMATNTTYEQKKDEFIRRVMTEGTVQKKEKEGGIE